MSDWCEDLEEAKKSKTGIVIHGLGNSLESLIYERVAEQVIRNAENFPDKTPLINLLKLLHHRFPMVRLKAYCFFLELEARRRLGPIGMAVIENFRTKPENAELLKLFKNQEKYSS